MLNIVCMLELACALFQHYVAIELVLLRKLIDLDGVIIIISTRLVEGPVIL